MSKIGGWLVSLTDDNEALGTDYGRWKTCESGRVYECADGTKITTLQKRPNIEINWTEIAVPTNCVYYRPQQQCRMLLFGCIITGAYFSRDMEQIMKGTDKAKLITFPSTTITVAEDAFQNIAPL